MKFSLSSCHMNVSPLASSILYHLFGKSTRVDGNKCGHAHSSLYPSFLHSFSHVLIWSSGFCPWMNIDIWASLVNFSPPNLSTKKVQAAVQVCSLVWWVSHHLAACPVKVSTRLWSRPCSPIFLETCSTCMTGDSLSLYLGICVVFTLVGCKVGYSLIFFSNIFGTMDTMKHCWVGFFSLFV